MNFQDIEIKEVIRSNRRTMAIEIKKNGDVILRIPNAAKPSDIQEMIEKRRDWIIAHRDKMLSKIIPPKRYETGEIFFFRGQTFPLEIKENKEFAIYFDGKTFKLDRELVKHGKKVFEIWYKRQAAKIILPRAYQLSDYFGYKLKQFRLSNADKRWGSCSSQRNINLSWRLIMADPKATDYVIVHELAHLKHLDHSRNFWYLVEQMMPDYEKYVKYLKDNANAFEL